MTEATSIGRQFFEAQDRLRGGPDRELCAIDYTADLNGNHMDFQGHEQFAAAFYGAFPDLEHHIESVEHGNEAERVRFRVTGTHQGDFMGVPATGKAIDVSADVILMLVDGKVESIVGTFDQAGMMKQLGVG